ncbi:carbohydrate ABC transporter permease [Mahella australiensis]|uniref:Carbohydrate ABC transporter membrane protein 2, CUT1 family n=1 Tax=Mahella australiensis (strain DSM 15567 / CIP 107919 / 50-1 BON) TaxID=697281 RepID=F4A253_MAHA5|nr:carbohydrate ABC transporter permease [Mahella australiensis]AEE97192.1 carbohydrate ABC transporter membrane protein 2, CUT1 family [Mahella australiensis 50-1 BON]
MIGSKKSSKYVFTITMIILSFIMLFPFVLMLSTSFKSMAEVYENPLSLLPDKIMFSNYKEAMGRGDWPRYFYNSSVITVAAVIISLLFNSTAGYAFARLNFKGRDILFALSLIGMMVPPQVSMVPIFIIMKHVPLAGGNNILGQGGIGWINSYMGIIAPYIAGAFGVFLFRQYYLNFPSSLDDAAKIDGLNRIQTFFRIYLPNSKPIIATLIALKTTSTWNDYTWPLIIIQKEELRTVQLALSLFRQETYTEWNLLMAATTLVILPVFIVFLLLQKYFVEGIVTSGLKA